MRYYFAPMECLTDSIYRQLHHKYFPGLDRYYTPFLSPTIHRRLTPKEARELPDAGSIGFSVVPQLLTKVPDDFLWMARQCKDLGYPEVNLNLGCPSGTVTTKGKGAGMLAQPDTLDTFLYEIFSKTPISISIKTRLGMEHPEEFPKILDIFNRYPIAELIVHPRTRSQFYGGQPDWNAFSYAVENATMPLCYNGNLCSQADIAAFSVAFPTVEAVMLGRGLIGNPGMLCGGTDVNTLRSFHDDLLDAYTQTFGSARNAMFRMKENWRYLLCCFENNGKLAKKLRKVTDISQYCAITQEIFSTLPMRKSLMPDW